MDIDDEYVFMITFHSPNHLHSSSSPVPVSPIVPEVSVDETSGTEASTEEGQQETNLNQYSPSNAFQSELSEAEKKQLRELKQRDREVRAHEQAHAAAAGSLAKGAPSYDYQRGPDGQLYAVGGSVSIDTSEVAGDPKATLDKAQRIQRAALAPAEPSSQDRAVAAEAAAMAAKARAELAQQGNEEFGSEVSGSEGPKTLAAESESAKHSCAECGGRHVSGSHSVSMKLEGAFNPEPEADKRFAVAA